MRSRMSKALSVGLCMGLLIATGLFAAQQKDDQLEIGKPVPRFRLPGLDGKQYGLGGLLKANKALVVVWMCNHCPVAVAYEDRLMQIQKDYKDKGVQVVAICSNDSKAYAADSPENLKKRAEERGFNWIYLHDESQEVARAYKAKVTPHVFLVNQKGIIAYRGSVDDDQKKPTKNHLRDALDAVLADKPVATPVTRQFGCTIKWKEEK